MPVSPVVFFFPAGEQDGEQAQDDFIDHRDHVRYHEIEQEECKDQQEQFLEPQAVGESHEYCDEGLGFHYLLTMILGWSGIKNSPVILILIYYMSIIRPFFSKTTCYREI